MSSVTRVALAAGGPLDAGFAAASAESASGLERAVAGSERAGPRALTCGPNTKATKMKLAEKKANSAKPEPLCGALAMPLDVMG